MKQIIISKDESCISHKSVREIINTLGKFGFHKIKTINTSVLVKVFSFEFHVMKNIQFLMFGQYIPMEGFR